MKIKYLVIGMVIGVLSTFALLWATSMFSLLGGDSLSNCTFLDQKESPDSKLYAYTYRDSGGGAAGWSMEIVCISSEKYIYGGDYEDQVLSISPSDTRIELAWLDVKTLEISYYLKDDTSTSIQLNQSRTHADIQIVFKQMSNQRVDLTR